MSTVVRVLGVLPAAAILLMAAGCSAAHSEDGSHDSGDEQQLVAYVHVQDGNQLDPSDEQIILGGHAFCNGAGHGEQLSSLEAAAASTNWHGAGQYVLEGAFRYLCPDAASVYQ